MGSFSQGGVEHAEELHAGALLPLAAPGGGGSGGNGPVGVEAPEMVDAQDVVDGQGVAHPADPPGIVGLFVVGPVVEGIAPQLAVGGKVVGGTACHPAGMAVGVHLKELAARPGVGGVGRYIDGHIPHDPDAVGVGVGLEGLPLLVELILHKGPETDLGGMGAAEFRQGGLVVEAQGPGPLLPVGHLLLLLDGHVQAVVGQPAVTAEGEAVPVVGVGGVAAGDRTLLQKGGVGLAQDGQPLFVQDAVVHLFGVAAPVGEGVVGAGEQSLRRQQVQVDEIGVARKGGAALVGAVAVAGGAHGQDLPDTLSRPGQEVHKPPCRGAQRTDAMPAGQAGQRHEDAACAFCQHFRSSPSTPK